MKSDRNRKRDLAMRNIFRFMMENGYSPVYENDYITFDMDDNTSVVDYENGVLSVRTFFTIEEEGYDMFLEASNLSMLRSRMVKPVIMEDMTSIMFSCETLCENLSDIKRFLPKIVELCKEGLQVHKNEMKSLLKATEMLSRRMPAAEEQFSETGKSSRGKLLS